MTNLVFPDQMAQTKVIDLRCSKKGAHTVRLDTLKGIQVAKSIALMVQSVEKKEIESSSEGKARAGFL